MRRIVLLAFLALFGLQQIVSSLKIGSFNIQAFGLKKLGNNTIMTVIKKIIKRYDIVLLQEIRDSTQQLLPSLIAKLNYRSRIKYQFAVSEIVGRNVYKEQYAFLYRINENIKLLNNYTYNDGKEENKNDLFSREPFVAHFEVPCSKFKKFTLVGVHISPDEAVEEIKLLEKVHDSVTRKFRTSNVIIMGDMNADCNYFRESKWQEVSMRRSSAYTWPICDDVDTTVKGTHCAYDRFIVGGRDLRNSYVPGYAKAFRFDEAYRMKPEAAEAVSDHYPIEIVFENKCGKSTDSVVG
ncbi:deoxyribonuclease-1 [Octopus bimaculoides]|uniref:Deoxyribonuclease n=1 Tax=Octopus bimaculoides TaxID=37653 RepID=A0A0L8IHE8_OCTBM|nr:deoxyribonuclease-1 [Octopus bimaculoides]|eukprot:XP_014768032.1 PREDICTED: deoxyribonuclease-1-like [Octopus bimaculoides]